jgi:predicted ATP-dependent Lon-type protease
VRLLGLAAMQLFVNAGWNWVEFGGATSGASALVTNVSKAAIMTAGGELTLNATTQLAKQAAKGATFLDDGVAVPK